MSCRFDPRTEAVQCGQQRWKTLFSLHKCCPWASIEPSTTPATQTAECNVLLHLNGILSHAKTFLLSPMCLTAVSRHHPHWNHPYYSCCCVGVLQGTPEFVAVSQCVHYFEWRTYTACKKDKFKPHKEVRGGTSEWPTGRLWRRGVMCEERWAWRV